MGTQVGSIHYDLLAILTWISPLEGSTPLIAKPGTNLSDRAAFGR